MSAGDDLLRRRLRGELGEVAHVAEHHRDLDLHSLLGEALGEDVLGDLLVEVGAEGLAQTLALGQPLDHLVEVRREHAELVAGRDRHGGLEVAAANALDRELDVAQRAQDRLRQHPGELERDRRRDQQRDEHVEAEVGAIAGVGGERGDDEAGDQVDQRQGDGEAQAQRHRPEVGRHPRRQAAVDVDQQRTHAGLDGEVMEHRRVTGGDEGAGEQRKEGEPALVEHPDADGADRQDRDPHRKG